MGHPCNKQIREHTYRLQQIEQSAISYRHSLIGDHQVPKYACVAHHTLRRLEEPADRDGTKPACDRVAQRAVFGIAMEAGGARAEARTTWPAETLALGLEFG